jgi:hypothetical protein
MPALITENIINVFTVSDTFPIMSDLVRTSVLAFFVTTPQEKPQEGMHEPGGPVS